MSRRARGLVEATPTVAVRPGLEVEAQAVRAFVTGQKGSEREADVAMQGVGDGSFKSVTVYGVDGNGEARQRMDFEVGSDGSGKVMVETPEGRCALGAIDGALPRMVEHQRKAMERKGLRAEVRYEFRDEIYRDQARADQLRGKYGIQSSSDPNWRRGYEPAPVLQSRSGRTGTMVRMTSSRKKR